MSEQPEWAAKYSTATLVLALEVGELALQREPGLTRELANALHHNLRLIAEELGRRTAVQP